MQGSPKEHPEYKSAHTNNTFAQQKQQRHFQTNPYILASQCAQPSFLMKLREPRATPVWLAHNAGQHPFRTMRTYSRKRLINNVAVIYTRQYEIYLFMYKRSTKRAVINQAGTARGYEEPLKIHIVYIRECAVIYRERGAHECAGETNKRARRKTSDLHGRRERADRHASDSNREIGM